MNLKSPKKKVSMFLGFILCWNPICWNPYVEIPSVGFIPAMFHDSYHWTIPRSSSNASTPWSSSWRLRSRQPLWRGRRRWTTNATTRPSSLGRSDAAWWVPLGPVGDIHGAVEYSMDIGDPPVKHGWKIPYPNLHLKGILDCHVWSLEGYFGSYISKKQGDFSFL